MKNTERNPKQPKVFIEVMSKTVNKLTKDLDLKAIVNSIFDSQAVSNSVRQLKLWNNGAGPKWMGEKRLQTDLGDQFIF